MTGAYLWGKGKDGKKTPVEIEHLTLEELHKQMKDRSTEELINWIDALCSTIRTCEKIFQGESEEKEEQ